MRYCSIEDCSKVLKSNDLCSMHAERKRKYGHPNKLMVHPIPEWFKDKTFVDVVGYDGLYKMNPNGDVYRTVQWSNRKLRLLKRFIDTNGYYFYNLYTDSHSSPKLHRLIAKTFIPNPNNYPDVNHIDGNKLNNSIDNLEWCTKSQNTLHAYKLGLHKKYYGTDKKRPALTDYDVHLINDMYVQGMTFINLAAFFGVSRDTVSKIIKQGGSYICLKT